MTKTGENVVRIEAEALRALADRIGGPMAEAFQRAVELMHGCAGRVVVTGMGKSGLIARKRYIAVASPFVFGFIARMTSFTSGRWRREKSSRMRN